MPTYGLVRYGAVPEVARCGLLEPVTWERGTPVVVETHRGELLGTWLERLPNHNSASSTPVTNSPDDELDSDQRVLRVATRADQEAATRLAAVAEAAFMDWNLRIRQWGLDLELVDLEQTLDGQKWILYVLAPRGPDCTKLALQAAASGLGIIEVQPVSAQGLVTLPQESSGGCGSGGCGSGGCHN